MPHDYDESQRSYRDQQTEKYLSRRALRTLINKLTKFTKKEATRIAARFDAGSITAEEFNLEMRELLKDAHIVAATIGRGGRERMTVADWGRVGEKLRWQYGYLDNFTRKLGRGTLKIANTENRARQYVSSVYVSYARSLQAAEKEFIDRGGDTNPEREMLCRLVQNSKEGCEECTADAEAGWMPVSEMGEIGTRICGDFCLCEIEFEDEI